MHRTNRAIMIGGASIAGTLLVLQLGHVVSREVAAWTAMAIFGVASFAPLARRKPDGDAVLGSGALPDWLDASESLIEFVQRRGNVLYVWGSELGGGLAVLRASLERPLDIQFEEVLRDPFRLRLATDIAPGELRLRYRSWPRQKILVDAGEFAGDGEGGADGG
jgi:hypothetical protein